jgi:hypothetical protein
MHTSSLERCSRHVPLVAGLIMALPVLIARYPPMADLPLHEACVGLLRHWGDTRFAPPTLYFINFGHSNQLFSLLVLALAYVFPIAWATKIVVAASVCALPLAAQRFATHVGAPRWTALLVAPLGFGWLFFWGLIQNIIGIVTVLALLPAIDTFATRPTRRGAVAICVAMLLLHFAHEAMQLVACAALVICSIGSSARPRLVLLRAIPVAFCGTVVYVAHRYAWQFAGARHRATSLFIYYPLDRKLFSVPGVLFGGFEPYVRNLMMLLACVPVVLFLADRARRPRPISASIFQRLHIWRFELLALALVVLYFAAPANIKSTTLVHHRFLPPAWAILSVSLAAGLRHGIRPLRVMLCAAMPLASLLIVWPTFADSHRMYSDLDALLPNMERGSAVMSINFGPDPPHRLWSPVVATGYVVAEHGGRSIHDYTQSPVSIVAQRPEKQWLEPLARLEGRLGDIRPAWDFTRFRYLLLATTKPSIALSVSMAMKDDARLAASKGDWYLFESKLPLAPIDADDAPLPQPHPKTLRFRMKQLAQELETTDVSQWDTLLPDDETVRALLP